MTPEEKYDALVSFVGNNKEVYNHILGFYGLSEDTDLKDATDYVCEFINCTISYYLTFEEFSSIETLGLLCTAILYHSMYNNLMDSPYAIYGAFFPIITYGIFLLITSDKHVMRKPITTNK